MPACSVVQPVDIPTVASAVVRNAQHGPHGMLKEPVCKHHCDANAPASATIATEDVCGVQGGLLVPFDTRSYLLSTYEVDSCASTRLGVDDYACVDYARGAHHLAGLTLSMELELSGVACGCNAALYLISMPQNHYAGDCHDFYCDANNVCGTSCTEIGARHTDSHT